MNNVITVGGRRVLYTDTLLLGDNEPVRIELALQLAVSHAGKDSFRLDLIFLDRDKTPPTVTWQLVDDIYKVNCIGWNSPTGSALVTPLLLAGGLLGPPPVALDLAHYAIGNRNLVHLVLLGGAADAS